MLFKERIAIIDGIRTPMAKAGTTLKTLEADDLAAIPIRELLARTATTPKDIDELIIGNCAQPAHAANVARVIALKAGIPKQTSALTVHRNCASGMEAITTGANRIALGEHDIILAGGVESMSNIPLLYNKEATAFFENLMKSKTPFQTLKTLSTLRPRFFKPIIGLLVGLTDPVCNLIMGMTAENLAREFHITREEQDKFALLSHKRAEAAIKNGTLAEEIIPILTPPKYKDIVAEDNGPRKGQSIKALAKLRPYFDKKTGTVTVGTSSQITDGAAAVILMSEKKAKALGHTPLGYLKAYAYAGCDPERMGLGPAFATAKLLKQSKREMKDFDRIEINEAFAAQVIANIHAFDSEKFAKDELGRKTKLGAINPKILNVNGGAIALGHPLGMTGTRLVITLLKELKRNNLQTGLATLCIGGGQGAALLLEAT